MNIQFAEVKEKKQQIFKKDFANDYFNRLSWVESASIVSSIITITGTVPDPAVNSRSTIPKSVYIVA